jgi:hypothetical protein
MFEGTRREAETSTYFDTGTLNERFPVGTPEQIADHIRKRTQGLPVTDIYFWADYPGIPDELIDRHLELSFSKLAPLLRA